MNIPRQTTNTAEQWHQAAADRIYERIEAGENLNVTAALWDAHLNIPSDQPED